MAAGDLTTLAAVKDWLQISGYTDDALLTRLIANCSAGIQNYLNRNFALTNYDEVRSGTGTRRMLFANYPATSISAVTVDGADVQKSPDGIHLPGWVNDSRGIIMIGGVWTAGVNNVTFSYTAGFAEPPADITQACIDWVSFIYRRRDRIGHASKSVQGETVSYITSAMPSEVGFALSPHKKVVPL